MSRRRLLLAPLLLLAPAAARASADPLRVVASFSILGDFVREVGGEAVRVETLVGPDRDAHVFEPSPADARRLAAAQVVVVNGLGFEGWMARLVRASGFRGPTVVAAAAVRPLRARPGGGHRHDGGDPHAWLDPRRAATMVGTIAEGLGAADPPRAGLYLRNATAYAARLGALDAEIEAALAPIPPARRRVVASHRAFAYFEDRYGVEFRAPRGVSTASEPSAGDLARLIRAIRGEGVEVVFLENISDPRLIERIARESGARVGGRLYADALSGPDGPAPTYLAMMRHDAALLVAAMRGE